MTTAIAAYGQEPGRAAFLREGDKVVFWQTNHLTGGTGGVCVVKFGFESDSLTQPLDGLTLTIRVIDRTGTDLGVSRLVLTESLGGTRGARYREATFHGVLRWPGQEDGELSPLCYGETTLVVESAVAKQAGKPVDLVRFGQLELTTFQRVNVKVGK